MPDELVRLAPGVYVRLADVSAVLPRTYASDCKVALRGGQEIYITGSSVAEVLAAIEAAA